MRTFPYIALSLVLASSVASAATYTVDFDNDPSYPELGDDDLGFEGVDGWSYSESNPPPNAEGEYYPYAFISTSFASGRSASFGGYFNTMPDNFSMSRTFSELTAGEKSLSFQAHITDAGSVPPLPGGEWFLARDIFGFSVSDSDGDLLLTVELRPVDQNFVPSGVDTFEPGDWEIFYAFGTDALVSSTNAISATAVTLFSVDFGEEGLRFSYGQGDPEDPAHSGTAAGYDVNDTGVELTYTYQKWGDLDEGNGDNYFTVDNINVIDGIPEPTTAALAALGSLALLRRRRTH